MADENIESRVAELEIRISFQDQTIQELNDVVVRQQREFEKMARDLAQLKGQMGTLTSPMAGSQAPEPPPPHY